MNTKDLALELTIKLEQEELELEEKEQIRMTEEDRL